MKLYQCLSVFLFLLPNTVSAAQVLGTNLNTITGSSLLSASATVLNVPYYVQAHTNSCEAASLRMALAYYGIKATDMDIIKQFGYDPHLKDVINNIWDDPQKQFVGFVNSTGRGQGYGVYGLPVVSAIMDYDRKADYYSGTSTINPTIAAEAIRNGYPVMFWGYTSLTEPAYTWKTPAGDTVKAFRGEHVRLIVGVQGTSDNPAGFYVHDSFTKQKYKFISTADFMKNINSVPGVTDQMIVIR